MREATLATAHNFTLDELQAYDEGTLAPDRTAVVAAHLTAGCAACRAWIATSHEVGRLLHADADARLGDPDAFLLNTPPPAPGVGCADVCAPGGLPCSSSSYCSKGTWCATCSARRRRGKRA